MMRILFVTSTTFSVTLIVQLLQDIAKEHLTTNSIIEMTPVSLKLVVVNFEILAKFDSKFVVFGRRVVFDQTPRYLEWCLAQPQNFQKDRQPLP